MLAYLASPFSSTEPDLVEERRVAACRKAHELIALGIHTVSPVAHNAALIRETHGNTGWSSWSAFDLALLSSCHVLVVYCLPGWRESLGVSSEISAAQELGRPIFYLYPDQPIPLALIDLFRG